MEMERNGTALQTRGFTDAEVKVGRHARHGSRRSRNSRAAKVSSWARAGSACEVVHGLFTLQSWALRCSLASRRARRRDLWSLAFHVGNEPRFRGRPTC